MYFVNPLYVISNIIYIKPDIRYVMVEKSCWNTVVHLLFRGMKPENARLKKLKDLFFRTYVRYSSDGFIDFFEFHSVLAEIQKKKEESKEQIISLVNEMQVVPMNVSGTEVEVYEETFFDTEFITTHGAMELQLSEDDSKFLSEYDKKRSRIEDQAKEVINYNIARSVEHKNLVSYIGFGSLLTMFRKLFFDGKLKFNSRFESTFFKANMDFLWSLIKHKCDDTGLFFICDGCEGINFHKYAKLTRNGDGYSTLHSSESQIKWCYKYEILQDDSAFLLSDNLPISRDLEEIPGSLLVRYTNFMKFPLESRVPMFFYKSESFSHLNVEQPFTFDIEKQISAFILAERWLKVIEQDSNYNILSYKFRNTFSRSLYADRYFYDKYCEIFKALKIDDMNICYLLMLDVGCLDQEYSTWINHLTEDSVQVANSNVIAQDNFVNMLERSNQFL